MKLFLFFFQLFRLPKRLVDPAGAGPGIGFIDASAHTAPFSAGQRDYFSVGRSRRDRSAGFSIMGLQRGDFYFKSADFAVSISVSFCKAPDEADPHEQENNA